MERSWKDYNKDLVKRGEILRKIKQKSPLQASAIHSRHTREDFQFDNSEDIPHDFVIVLDSTDIKLTNRREWLSKKHGKKRRRGWIKVHVAIDISSGRVLHMKVTDNKTHDSQCAVELVENSVKKVEAGGCEVTRK